MDQQAFREKTVGDIERLRGKIDTLQSMLDGQGKDVSEIKISLSDMWKAVNWSSAKINYFLGGIAALVTFGGILLTILGLLS